MAGKTALLLAITWVALATVGDAAVPQPKVDFEQKLNALVPDALEFRDELGRSVRLGNLLREKPILLSLVYFRCPNLCNLVLEGLLASLRGLPQKLGRDYRILTVSIDPSEGNALALARKRATLARLQISGPSADADPAWHFLTGQEAQVRALARTVGFGYSRDPATGQFAHGSGFIVLTPDGRVSRYFFGVRFDTEELSRAISQAARNHVGGWAEQLLLLCFHYDPVTGKHGPVILRALRICGLSTLLGLAILLVRLSRTEARA